LFSLEHAKTMRNVSCFASFRFEAKIFFMRNRRTLLCAESGAGKSNPDPQATGTVSWISNKTCIIVIIRRIAVLYAYGRKYSTTILYTVLIQLTVRGEKNFFKITQREGGIGKLQMKIRTEHIITFIIYTFAYIINYLPCKKHISKKKKREIKI
jgi:hypothetical protein